jgi:hypothetical protein
VYAQLDVEAKINNVDTIFLPQIVALDQIHELYPNATLWEMSARNWFALKGRFNRLDLPGYDYRAGVLELPSFYQNHTQRIQEFVK